ncbi:SDR family oxidoreductase [Streptomyces sp. NPDC054975]
MAVTAPMGFTDRADFAPRTAIVTGSDSGIGRAVAVRLAEEGMDVGITWHHDKAGAAATSRAVRAAGRRAALARLDLAALPEAAGVIDVLAESLGGVDVLVNNAGTGVVRPFLDLDLPTVRQVIEVDLLAPLLCAQRAARRMIEQGGGGRIVNITSVHDRRPRPGAGPACAAYAGLGLLTEVMALELAEHRITVNAVSLGETATDPEDDRATAAHHRPGDAAEVAAAIALLVTDDASHVTSGGRAA